MVGFAARRRLRRESAATPRRCSSRFT